MSKQRRAPQSATPAPAPARAQSHSAGGPSLEQPTRANEPASLTPVLDAFEQQNAGAKGAGSASFTLGGETVAVDFSRFENTNTGGSICATDGPYAQLMDFLQKNATGTIRVEFAGGAITYEEASLTQVKGGEGKLDIAWTASKTLVEG